MTRTDSLCSLAPCLGDSLRERGVAAARSFNLHDYLARRSAPLVVVAHPDDEILGVGAQLPRWPGTRFVHVTDGAPRDMRDATAAGFGSRAAYAACRKRELRTALERAGFGFESQQQLDFVDQDVSFELPTLTRMLVDLFNAYRPAAVITHPYEGGHPDHDGVAFAVDCARRLTQAASGESPAIIEMTSYHNRAGLMQTGEFLPDLQSPVISLPLNPEQSRVKHELLETFISQAKVLDQFSLQRERFRLAPSYNFQQPPHQGTLFYEQYGLGWDGESWRDVASQALTEIEISLEPDGA